jgi:hypothetical protein
MTRVVLLAAAALLYACCAPLGGTTADAHVRTALNVLADVIDPAAELVKRGCQDEHAATLREVEAGKRTAVGAEDQINATSRRCNAQLEVFDGMRKKHELARGAVEAGRVEEAEHLIESIRQTWRELGDL